MVALQVILGLFLAANAYTILRGRERQSIDRTIFNHSALLAPFNALFYLLSPTRARPWVDRRSFPALDRLRDNWLVLREEAQRIFAETLPAPVDPARDLAFHSFMKRGWNRFYLSWYGASLPSAERLAPRTVALLRQIPEIRGAMFALLPPGGKLGRHRDPYAGSLRYHLGLECPDDDRCWIKVDGQRYSWRDGTDVIFDETFLHEARNDTDRRRIILFADIRRPLRPRFLEKIAYGAERLILAQTASINTEEDRLGALNALFPPFFRYRVWAKQFKRSNRVAYAIMKWGLLLGAVALLVVLLV